MRRRLSELPRLLAEIAAPPACAVCGSDCGRCEVLCPRCEAELARGHGVDLEIPGVDRAWAARPYEGVTRDLIHAVKFRDRVPALGRAAELIGEEAPEGMFDDGVLVDVPADPLREAWRGWDPAYALARMLMHTACGAMLGCLVRSHSRRQVGRSRGERLASPPRVRAVGSLPGEVPLILVDDVSTTGATLAACAAALREAGCAEVRAVVLGAAAASHWGRLWASKEARCKSRSGPGTLRSPRSFVNTSTSASLGSVARSGTSRGWRSS